MRGSCMFGPGSKSDVNNASREVKITRVNVMPAVMPAVMPNADPVLLPSTAGVEALSDGVKQILKNFYKEYSVIDEKLKKIQEVALKYADKKDYCSEESPQQVYKKLCEAQRIAFEVKASCEKFYENMRKTCATEVASAKGEGRRADAKALCKLSSVITAATIHHARISASAQFLKSFSIQEEKVKGVPQQQQLVADTVRLSAKLKNFSKSLREFIESQKGGRGIVNIPPPLTLSPNAKSLEKRKAEAELHPTAYSFNKSYGSWKPRFHEAGMTSEVDPGSSPTSPRV
jgi:hypothetical protein